MRHPVFVFFSSPAIWLLISAGIQAVLLYSFILYAFLPYTRMFNFFRRFSPRLWYYELTGSRLTRQPGRPVPGQPAGSPRPMAPLYLGHFPAWGIHTIWQTLYNSIGSLTGCVFDSFVQFLPGLKLHVLYSSSWCVIRVIQTFILEFDYDTMNFW